MKYIIEVVKTQVRFIKKLAARQN